MAQLSKSTTTPIEQPLYLHSITCRHQALLPSRRRDPFCQRRLHLSPLHTDPGYIKQSGNDLLYIRSDGFIYHFKRYTNKSVLG
jgi:hypothetical protein